MILLTPDTLARLKRLFSEWEAADTRASVTPDENDAHDCRCECCETCVAEKESEET